MNKAIIVSILQEHDFSIDYFNYANERCTAIKKYTPCGEDWFEEFSWKSAKAFTEELENFVDNFDIDEQIEVWLPLRGTRGVPEHVTDLIEDAKWKLEQLEQLLLDIKGVK